MAERCVSRRQVLRVSMLGIPAGAILKLVPLQAAQQTHDVVQAERATKSKGVYTPKFFKPDQYKTLRVLCQAIVPPDDHSGGALEAGAPEFIDLLTSENENYQRRLGGGLMWLDAICLNRYGRIYVECPRDAQKEILDLIAYRTNAEKDSSLVVGIEFFSLLRDLTVDGYFTSEIGIKYLRYIGNTFLAEFPGCPPVPGL